MLLLLSCTAAPNDSAPAALDSPGVDSVEPHLDSDRPWRDAVVVVNEFMASNRGSLSLEDGSTPDWLELYNAGPEAVELSDWTLSDSSEDPGRFELPEGWVLEPGAHLLFYADGLEQEGHLPFGLTSEGEEIVLSTPDGVIHDWIAYEAQAPDVAAARSPDGGEAWIFVPSGSPGATND